jgi:hypothetical protein
MGSFLYKGGVRMKSDLKFILISLFIVVIIFSLSLFIKNYLEKTTSLMLSEITHIEFYVNSNEWDKAYTKITELNNKWEQIDDKWTFLINHHEIDEISVSILNTTEYIKGKDRTQALSALSSVKHYISHIPKMETVSLENIL